MERPDRLETLIRRVYDPSESGIFAPDVSKLKARKMVSTRAADRPDIFSMLAGFLNLRLKLYQAALAFFIVWMAVMLLGRGDAESSEEASPQPYGGIAAVRNSTILSSCQTFVLKK